MRERLQDAGPRRLRQDLRRQGAACGGAADAEGRLAGGQGLLPRPRPRDGVRQPDRYVATITKSKRQGKILIDYLRNQRGATAVAAYSTRARPGAQVSAPLTWDELAGGAKPADFTVADDAPARCKRCGSDPWDGFAAAARPLTG